MPSRRYIRHSHDPPIDALDAMKQDISNALPLNVEAVYQNTRRRTAPSTASGGGVYVGIAGITLMLSRLSSSKLAVSPEFLPASDQVLASVVKLSVLEGGLKVRSPARISFLETDVGVSALVLLRIIEESSNILLNDTDWRHCITLLQSALKQVLSRRPNTDDNCEVLYGRAGFLYAVLLIRRASRLRADSTKHSKSALSDEFLESFESLTSDDNIRAIVREIVVIGREGAWKYGKEIAESGLTMYGPPLMWAWHGKRYLGAAHGVAGILQMLWSCPSHIVAPYISDMTDTLIWLIGQQDKSGNWPTKAPVTQDGSVGDNELVQWCHGAPGIIMLLSTVLRRSLSPRDCLSIEPDLQEQLIESMRLGGRLVYRHGLLRKGVGICHGVAGSVYALLAISDILDHHSTNPAKPDQTPKKKYLLRAVHLAHLAKSYESLTANGDMSTPDRPWSLYEGMAGMCCAWAEVLLRLEGKRSLYRGMPGYDDLDDPLVL